MATNEPRSPQDPRPYSNDPTRPYSNDPDRPYSRDPLANGSSSYQSPGTSNDTSTNQDPNRPREERSSFKAKTEEVGDKIKAKTEEVGDKLKGTFKNIKESKQVNEMYHYARSNKERTITYLLLALGVILLFINTILGGLLIGLVAGYFFSDEIVYFGKNIRQFFESQDHLRYLVMIVATLALLIAAPGIVIGAIVAAAFTHIMKPNPEETERTETNKFSNDKSQRPGDGPR